MDAAEAPAWVLQAEGDRELRRAVRLVERFGADRKVVLDSTTVCVELSDPLSIVHQVRTERRLKGAVEVRPDCDVAWYPSGRGYVAYSVSQPAPTLEDLLDAEGPIYHEIVRPSDPGEPARICLPRLAIADPLALAEALKIQGIGVLATYEVGGCRR